MFVAIKPTLADCMSWARLLFRSDPIVTLHNATSSPPCRISGRRERQNRKCTHYAHFFTVEFDTGNGVEHAQ